ncbi:histidine kinase [Streptomyces tubbatahanensis]|uniref:histidine kinase n=1 Tax=Streptomyces tubbatahanensis TaxID=2923272 RepID=A0ABY3XW92_9ACTN|nr:sensor histidine kinase [Streptomyces tubbatahanensis]UNS98756.1 histidine kinase [Streptomyces tubbatahanensis]
MNEAVRTKSSAPRGPRQAAGRLPAARRRPGDGRPRAAGLLPRSRRRVPVGHLAAVGAGGAAVLAVVAGPWWIAATAGCAFLAGLRRGSGRVAALLLATALAVAMVTALTVAASLTPGTRFVAIVLLAGMLPWCAGRFWRQYRQLAQAGWERAARLTRERRLVAERARERERTRVAQDMHDALGHELGLLALSAGALKLAPGLSPEHRAAAADIRGRAEAAVDRLGEVIGVLRASDEAAPVRPADTGVSHLLREAAASGLAVTAYVDEPARDAASAAAPPRAVLDAAHRVVQEGLTNVAKHAPDAAVTVRVTRTGTDTATDAGTATDAYTDADTGTGASGGGGGGGGGHGLAAAGVTRVEVVNGPAPGGAPERRAVGGHGLPGLGERVRLVGGSLGHGPTPDGGFALRAVLPHDRPPHPPLPEDSCEAPFADEQRSARRAMGRTALTAVTSCLLACALLGGALTWWDMLRTERTVLSAEDFGRLRAGQQRERIASLLPGTQTSHRPAHAPPPPQEPGTRCEHYAMTANPFDDRSGDVYRLCFRAGTLASARALHA